MANTLHLVGDGLAGSLLALELQRNDIEYHHYGNGSTNTPPVGFVHLFQGRTFHRKPIELKAFEHAVSYWKNHPHAREWEVERSITHGDRLHRSIDTDTVPVAYRPRLVGELLYRYHPGFMVACRHLKPTDIDCTTVDTETLDGRVIHATGLAIEKLLPDLRWDTNPGRTVLATSKEAPQMLYLKNGCHLGADPDGPRFTIGGRVNSKGESKGDEAELAAGILGAPVTIESEWQGKRIANALDRLPIIGWLDEQNFVFAGFGSRALFWLPYCTKVAALAIQEGNNQQVPTELCIKRFPV